MIANLYDSEVTEYHVAAFKDMVSEVIEDEDIRTELFKEADEHLSEAVCQAARYFDIFAMVREIDTRAFYARLDSVYPQTV